MELADTDGQLAWVGHYRAWGKLTQASDGHGNPSTTDNPLRFQGQYLNDETGLHYNRHRYYDPEIGRFTTQDPIGLAGGDNLYVYAPNPTGWVDPLGLSGCCANVNAQAALRAKLSGLQKAQQNGAKTRALPDGRVRYYTQEVPARSEGPTREAYFVTEYNPDSGSVRQWMESYDLSGSVIRVHPKSINGQTLGSQHYPPTGYELKNWSRNERLRHC